MRKRFQENDLGFRLAPAAFAALVAGLFSLGRARPDIGKKQNTHGGQQDHDEQPEIDTAFHP